MEINWTEQLGPLLKQYEKRKHPLEYLNRYQLVVMVILSARDSDKHINQLASSFFGAYPSIADLALATSDDLYKYIGSVTNFANKADWLVKLAKMVGEDHLIPSTLGELTKLPGIGRKSANVIIRESGDTAEGIIVDLHVVRVAPRLGIASGTNPEKIEKQLMGAVLQEKWNDTGMAISFLGREICRPTNPKCNICIMNTVCNYYSEKLGTSGI
jgi:endonuclease III